MINKKKKKKGGQRKPKKTKRNMNPFMIYSISSTVTFATENKSNRIQKTDAFLQTAHIFVFESSFKWLTF